MKTILKKTGLLLIMMICIVSVASAQAKKKADKATETWDYEIEVVRQGTPGTYLVKVWSYSKKYDVAVSQAKKNAVHGVIFKGFPQKGSVAKQDPLTNNVNLEEEKADFFKPFFADGGKYMKFVSISGDGSIEAGDVIKVGKEYKVGVIISVNVSELRKDLENAGILKSLGAGFN